MRHVSKVLFGAAILGLAATVNAVPIPWSNPNGTVPGQFSWSGGASDNGLFGSPIVAGNSFTFFPSNFKALGQNGTAQTTSDRLSFTLDVAPGFQFDQIRVTELGDWAITNGGQVSADTFLFVTNLDIPVNPPVNPQTGSDSFAAALPAPNSNQGQWTTQVIKNLPNGWTRVQVVLNNILQASAPAAGTAFIEKKVGGITVTIEVPEPGMISVAMLGMGALLVRRRK